MKVPRTREQAARLLDLFDGGDGPTRDELARFMRRIALAATKGIPLARQALGLLLVERRWRTKIGIN